MPDLVSSIKKAALDAVEAAKPVAALFGTVISVVPLEINVEQKMTLTVEQLVITQNSVFAAGSKVILLRIQGGQKFVVLGSI